MKALLAILDWREEWGIGTLHLFFAAFMQGNGDIKAALMQVHNLEFFKSKTDISLLQCPNLAFTHPLCCAFVQMERKKKKKKGKRGIITRAHKT